MSIYIEKEELLDNYNEAERVAEDWYKPFKEYERIAGNKLSSTLGKNMPRVNDGSLAAALLETPMNVLPTRQQGKFTSTTRKKAWLDEIANIIWETKIVPNANTQAAFFDKEQIALYRATKYGVQPRYNFFRSDDQYTGSDWSLPYVKNIKLEPGKYSEQDCDYIWMDIYYTKLQLKRIIEQNKKNKDSSWNLDALKTLVNMSMTQKEMKDQNINEQDKKVYASGIKCSVCFQRGVNAPFYMISKYLPAGELVRVWKNPDPTGDLPITLQFCYETLESPVGIGRVELAGPTQNVLDYMTQAHVLATQIGLQPPKKVKGSLDQSNLNSLVNIPDATWLLGNADVEIVQNTNSVYTQFPANFGLYKSQLQNLQGRTDGSVSAQSGNGAGGFSKTPAGVNMQEERTNSQDNYLRNKADTASARMAEKMMNVHMAQMQGADILDIAEDDLERLTKAGYFDDNPETPEPSLTELPIMYEEIKDTFKFKYDPRPEADNETKSRWLELIDIVSSNPNIIPAIQASGYDLNIGEMFKKVIEASGTDGWDKVLVKLNPEDMNGMGEIDPATGLPIPGTDMPDQAGMTPEMGMEQPMPAEMTAPEAPQQAPIDPDELQATMEMYGIPEPDAMAVMEARKRGFAEEEIVAFLKGEMNNG